MHKLDSVPSLTLSPVVLSCGCCQSSEAVSIRRERKREAEPQEIQIYNSRKKTKNINNSCISTFLLSHAHFWTDK